MLEFIGLVAVIYLIFKYLPDFVWFFIKFCAAIFLLTVLLWALTAWGLFLPPLIIL